MNVKWPLPFNDTDFVNGEITRIFSSEMRMQSVANGICGVSSAYRSPQRSLRLCVPAEFEIIINVDYALVTISSFILGYKPKLRTTTANPSDRNTWHCHISNAINSIHRDPKHLFNKLIKCMHNRKTIQTQIIEPPKAKLPFHTYLSWADKPTTKCLPICHSNHRPKMKKTTNKNVSIRSTLHFGLCVGIKYVSLQSKSSERHMRSRTLKCAFSSSLIKCMFVSYDVTVRFLSNNKAQSRIYCWKQQ